MDSGVIQQARAPVERVLGAYGRAGGPLLLVTAGIHGNEPAGIVAVRRVVATLREHGVTFAGRFVALSGNRAALAHNTRHIDEDMNRVWSSARVAELETRDTHLDTSEQREQRELIPLIEAELACNPERVTHLDLHSTSGLGPPFTVIAGPQSSRVAANNLCVPLLLGLESIIAGTLIEYIGRRGHSAMVLEGGQNDAATTIDHHESAIWLTLVHSGAIRARDVDDLERHRDRLLRGAGGLPDTLTIEYVHRLREGERFEMLAGFQNFDPVSEGQLLAHSGPDLRTEVRAPWTGTMIMPRYQGQGLDGFFLGR